MKNWFLIFLGGVFLLGLLLDCSVATEAARARRKLAWWESNRAAQNDPASQLAFADQLRDQGRLRQASRQYRALTYAWPHAAEAPQAQFRLALLLEQRGKTTRAFNEYQYLLDTYAGFVPYAEVLERQYAMADNLASRTNSFLFFRYQSPEEAIPYFETLIQNAPYGKHARELQFRIARIYQKNKQYPLAMDAYALYQQNYPVSPLTESAAFSQGVCACHYSQNNPHSVDLRMNAIAILDAFLDRYPRSDMAAGAQNMLKILHEEQARLLFRQAGVYERNMARSTRGAAKYSALGAAALCYQRVIDEYPLSDWSKKSQQRMVAIEHKMEACHVPANK